MQVDNINSIDYCEHNSKKSLCSRCINKFIQCSCCKGYFLQKFYFEKHENFCKLINKVYQENQQLITCNNCQCLIDKNEMMSHKAKCSLNKNKVLCNICKKEFQMNLIEEHEKNCQKIHSELMLVNEKVECEFCKLKFSLINISEHEESCYKLQQEKKKLQSEISDMNGMKVNYPQEWQFSNINNYKVNEKVHLIPILNNNSIENSTIQDIIWASYPRINITQIYRIQNKILYQSYDAEKAKINKEKGGFVEEKLLFYGCKNTDTAMIYTNGPDISFSLDKNSYGRGLYFQNRFTDIIENSYKRYNKSYIFVASVLIGIPFLKQNQDTSMRKPPFYKEDKFIYYDSVTNKENFEGNRNTQQTYVVYNNEKAYPMYLIEFKNK